MTQRGQIQTVPVELLENIAQDAPEPEPKKAGSSRGASSGARPSSNGQYTSRLLVEEWFNDRRIAFRRKLEPDGLGRTVFVLAACPFNQGHRDPDACVMQGADGKMSANCFHSSCKDKGWQEFKEAIGEPECHHYDPPLKKTRTKTGTGANGASHSANASIEIALPEGQPLKLALTGMGGKPRRLVVATRDDVEHRDVFDTDSSTSRERFISKVAAKLGIEPNVIIPLLESKLTKLAAEVEVQEHDHDAIECGSGEKSQATMVCELAAEWDLWHSPAHDGFATILVGGHSETWPLRSKAFKRCVCKAFYDEHQKALASEGFSAALNLLEARAIFDGPERPVFVRVAEHDGNIYLDLCNPKWQVVEITAQGWQVIDESPVRFRRSGSMQALSNPERGGHIDLLKKFLNVDPTTRVLIVSWLVGAFRPTGPYPVLALFAEQGAGKSTGGRFLRNLFDPNAAPLRSEPKHVRDLMIAANNSWCLAYDNLSYIPPWLSDAICRLATGGGYGTRELYSDQDEIIFDGQRPVILTSIEEVANRSDLLDRCLIVMLKAIAATDRATESGLNAQFQRDRPLILGALLNAVSVALRRLPTIKLAGLPRMADFAIWATAAETGFGWSPGTFMNAYQTNQDMANEIAIEHSVLAAPLLSLLKHQGSWQGPARDLLTKLEERVDDQVKHAKGWPRNPRALSGHLTRIAPNLRKMGWILERGRTANERSWSIRRADDANAAPSPPVASSFASPESGCDSMRADAEQRNLFDGDADDANDANSGTPWNPDRY
jgi:hypothetical protein